MQLWVSTSYPPHCLVNMDPDTVTHMITHYKRTISTAREQIKYHNKEASSLELRVQALHGIIDRLESELDSASVPQSDLCSAKPCVK